MHMDGTPLAESHAELALGHLPPRPPALQATEGVEGIGVSDEAIVAAHGPAKDTAAPTRL